MTSLSGVATVRLGRPDHRAWPLTGVPVAIAPSWLLGIALTAWTAADGLLPDAVPDRSVAAYTLAGFAAAAALAVTIALHEAAHCAAAQRAGLGVRRVTLGFLGGGLELAEAPSSPGVELRVALAGPLASALAAVGATLAHVLLVIVDADPLLAAATALVAIANGFIALLNCTPALPLDGGHVLRAILWAAGGRERSATAAALAIGRVLSVTILGLAVLVSASGAVGTAFWMALLGLSLSSA